MHKERRGKYIGEVRYGNKVMHMTSKVGTFKEYRKVRYGKVR